MTVDEKIVSALSSLNIPVEVMPYTGKAKTYFVFNYDTVPTNYGDNTPDIERYLIQLHLFAPINGFNLSTVKSVKTAISDAGFTYPSVTNATDEDDRHYVFEFEAESGV